MAIVEKQKQSLTRTLEKARRRALVQAHEEIARITSRSSHVAAGVSDPPVCASAAARDALESTLLQSTVEQVRAIDAALRCLQQRNPARAAAKSCTPAPHRGETRRLRVRSRT